MSAEPALGVEQHGAVRWLWLNRPAQRNALDQEIIAALDNARVDAELDPGTSVLVIAGRGASFCAGADLQTLLGFADAGDSPIEFLQQVTGTFRRLETGPLPVVAAIHGHAVAGGIELALAADVVVAAADALIGDGHIRNGLIPGGGSSVRLSRKLGASTARWLLLTGELLPAAELQSTGWIHSVVAQDALFEEAQRVAEQLAAVAGPAQAAIKPLLATTEDALVDEGLALELDAFAEHWKTSPIADDLRAFFAARGDR